MSGQVHPVLIDGLWQRPSDADPVFAAMAPADGSQLPDRYPVSNWDQIETALQAGNRAAAELTELPREALAAFLDLYADGIEARAEELVAMAHIETGLPIAPRLRDIELSRTTEQLHHAATSARDRSWTDSTIDTESNIRSMLGPLEAPVLVFGPNNFPFAFNSSAGGDFAAAIASGNPVIAKANTGHPGTTRLLTEVALAAINETGLPEATLQMMYRVGHEDGARLVGHPLLGATGFTGSRTAGLRLKAAADKAGKPIYLEMSSINPVLVLPGALEERGDKISSEFFAACTLGSGQFCTKPGLVVVVESRHAERFLADAANHFDKGPRNVLLSASAPIALAETITAMTSVGASVVTNGSSVDDRGFSFPNTLLRVSGSDFIASTKILQEEAFGPVSLVVFAGDKSQVEEIVGCFEGNLTGTVYSAYDGSDDEFYNRLERILRPKVGRLLNDKMPTGVAVVPSMNHGGPFPATGHPGFTAVGIPASLRRFAALRSYDNVRPHRLPLELRDENPTGHTFRLIDGEWTTASLKT